MRAQSPLMWPPRKGRWTELHRIGRERGRAEQLHKQRDPLCKRIGRRAVRHVDTEDRCGWDVRWGGREEGARSTREKDPESGYFPKGQGSHQCVFSSKVKKQIFKTITMTSVGAEAVECSGRQMTGASTAAGGMERRGQIKRDGSRSFTHRIRWATGASQADSQLPLPKGSTGSSGWEGHSPALIPHLLQGRARLSGDGAKTSRVACEMAQRGESPKEGMAQGLQLAEGAWEHSMQMPGTPKSQADRQACCCGGVYEQEQGPLTGGGTGRSRPGVWRHPGISMGTHTQQSWPPGGGSYVT